MWPGLFYGALHQSADRLQQLHELLYIHQRRQGTNKRILSVRSLNTRRWEQMHCEKGKIRKWEGQFTD